MGVLKARVGADWVPIGYAGPIESANWTPSWAALVVGTAGVNVGRYMFAGPTGLGAIGLMHLSVFAKFGTAGQTFPNNPSFSMPPGFRVLPSDGAIGTNGEVVGGCRLVDATPAAVYIGITRVSTATAIRPMIVNVGATYPTEVALTASVPMTWAQDDSLMCNCTLMAERI